MADSGTPGQQAEQEKLTLCKPGSSSDQDCVQPEVRDDSGDTAITTEATRSPPAPVRGGFVSDKTPRTTRRPFTAFNNFNIPTKTPQRLQNIKLARNSTRTAPRIPVNVEQKKVETSRKFKNKKPIKNKNKARKPKEFEDDRKADEVKGEFDEEQEPAPEPEPSGGHHGNPRHHAFHSCKYSLSLTVVHQSKLISSPGLYQKIDPKVREERRKKFFGSGRRRRSTVDDDFREVHLDSEPRQQKERDGAAEINRHGFHSCELHSSLHSSTPLFSTVHHLGFVSFVVRRRLISNLSHSEPARSIFSVQILSADFCTDLTRLTLVNSKHRARSVCEFQ